MRKTRKVTIATGKECTRSHWPVYGVGIPGVNHVSTHTRDIGREIANKNNDYYNSVYCSAIA